MTPTLPAPGPEEVEFGRSGQGRPLTALVSRAPANRPRILVIGTIHGNEPAPRGICDGIAEIEDDRFEVWTVPVLNPDGHAMATRRNARGVDLNRNFPHRWSSSDGGPGPGSEPETQAAMALVDEISPAVSIWVHQPLAYIAPIGGTHSSLADAWRGPAGLRRRDGVNQHGGGESWCAYIRGIPTVLIEASGWAADAGNAGHIAGFRQLLDAIDDHLVRDGIPFDRDVDPNVGTDIDCGCDADPPVDRRAPAAVPRSG